MKKRQTEDEGELPSNRSERTRTRILSASMKLLNSNGEDAVTTRAVAELAGVQPPMIYRLFGDKNGLLSALAEHGFNLYLKHKRAQEVHQDSVEALRYGWDRHVEFGLSHSSLYLLMYARPTVKGSAAAELSFAMLRRHVNRIAESGRLRVPEELAVSLFHSAALGIVITLLRLDPFERDLHLSVIARDNMLSMIAVTENARSECSPVAAAAMTLNAAVRAEHGFSPGEFSLFKEWLVRLEDE